LAALSPTAWIASEVTLNGSDSAMFPSHTPSLLSVLLMASHSSHMSPEVIQLVKDNQTFLFTFLTLLMFGFTAL
jgi:hypothetical protein